MPSTRRRVGLACLAVLAALAATAPAEATFPGRNGVIAFSQSGSSGGPGPIHDNSGLAVVVPRTGAPRTGAPRDLIVCEKIDDVPSGGDCTVTIFGSPSYSADGRRLVFDAGERLAVIDADGSGLTLLPATTANDGDPAFAPGGKRIVFTGTNDHGSTDVYVRRLSGGDARSIVVDASEPAWSSVNTLAYVREGNIYTADPGGRHRRFVTSGVSTDWSPNGGRLLLVRPPPNLTYAAHIGPIYVVGARGRGLRRITSGKLLANPVWSPDGRWFAYFGFEVGIHVRLLRGHKPREVATTQSGSEGGFVTSAYPAWRPRR